MGEEGEFFGEFHDFRVDYFIVIIKDQVEMSLDKVVVEVVDTGSFVVNVFHSFDPADVGQGVEGGVLVGLIPDGFGGK